MCPAPRSIADYRPTAAAECCYMAASRPSDAGYKASPEEDLYVDVLI